MSAAWTYEKDQKKLLKLWEFCNDDSFSSIPDEEPVDSESDNENDDHVSERSADSDSEQEILDDDIVEESEPEVGTKKYLWGIDKKTKWAETPGNLNVRTRRENIIIHLPGPKNIVRDAKTPIECWNHFIDEVMIGSIVEWTNQTIRLKSTNYSEKFIVQETTVVEIRAMFGLLYMAGRFRVNRLNLEDLWASDGSGVDMFRATMPLKRFKFLLCCLRFDNKNSREERRKIDKLAPIRAIFDCFVGNCKAAYMPSEYLTIDEKLEGFRGRCGFRQYIPNKPAKYGIKIFALVDSKTFYVLNQEVYVGQQPDGPFSISNKPVDIVQRLVEPIKGSRRNITFDNWFTSYELVIKLLKEYQLTSVGTLRKNKKEIPRELLATKGREEKSSKYAFQSDVSLVSYAAKKHKNVLVLSTLHNNNKIDTDSGDLRKPEHITFYNMTKGGVDTVDQMSANYNVSRNSRRWPLSIFFSLMNTASINAFVIYNSNTGGNIPRRYFIKELAISLVKPFQINRLQNPRISLGLRHKIADINNESLPGTSAQAAKRQKYAKRCHICPRNKDHKSFYTCMVCNNYVCLGHSRQKCDNCDSADRLESHL